MTDQPVRDADAEREWADDTEVDDVDVPADEPIDEVPPEGSEADVLDQHREVPLGDDHDHD